MNKIIESILTLWFIFTFSNGTVYLIKNVNKDDSFYLSILLTSLIVNLFIIIEQFKLLKKTL